jgi:hypothetical membrane protein
VAYLVIVIVIAQTLAPANYHWTRNTVSDLAAQGYANKALMQAGFIGFGLLLGIAALSRFTCTWFTCLREVLLAVYALCIAASGIACTAPFVSGVPYSATEARWHSVFATTAGVTFSLALFVHMFTDAQLARRWWHLLTVVAVLGLSLTFGLLTTHMGVVQRLLYGFSFVWLVFIYPGVVSERRT